MSFTISNDLFSAQAECSLTSFQLKSSRLAQDFCSEAIAWAPLCGMMLGRIAAPLVRFRSAQLFNSFGFNQTFSRFTSWGIGVSAEGTIMAAAPGVLMGQGLSPDLWRGSVHGTFTMMMAQGVARGIPMNGIIREVSQDLSFMAVNVVCGVAGITDQVNGSFMEQYCEARIVSVRMKISGELVHSTCVEATYAQAKVEVQRKVEESVSQGPKRENLSPLLELAANNGMRVKEIDTDWETSTQKVLKDSLRVFMGRKGRSRGVRNKQARTYQNESTPDDSDSLLILLNLTLTQCKELPEIDQSIIFELVYGNLINGHLKALSIMSSCIREVPHEFRAKENFSFAMTPYLDDPNSRLISIDDFETAFGKDPIGRSLPPTTKLIEAMAVFRTTRICVTTTEGMDFLTQSLIRHAPNAKVKNRTSQKTILDLPISEGESYTVIISTNRMLKMFDQDKGILMSELLRLQDEENDYCSVVLVKRKGEKKLIIRGSSGKSDLERQSGDILIAHTHPWLIRNFINVTPGETEIRIAKRQQNTQVGIYRGSLVIFHPDSQILSPSLKEEHYRRGKVSFITLNQGDDFLISASDENVLITPAPSNSRKDIIDVWPIVDVTLSSYGINIFRDGDETILDRGELERKVVGSSV